MRYRARRRGLCEARRFVNRVDSGFLIHAAMRAGELLERGDLDGAATWRRIIGAMKELGRLEPVGAVH